MPLEGFDSGFNLQGYAVNVPLCDGLCDDMFLETAFKPVMEEVILRFDPQVVVLQSGADSIASDKIGKFNLSTEGHASAGRWLREQHPNIPVMVLGGGGYTISNVARTWSYETISMLGYRDEDIPYLCPLVCLSLRWKLCLGLHQQVPCLMNTGLTRRMCNLIGWDNPQPSL
jgi:acetoin utilization deacetylase AcuC-like enzyme